MKPKPDSHIPPTPPLPHLPTAVKDFIHAVRPGDKTGPAEELTKRFADSKRPVTTDLMLPGPPKGGPEYLVELRIREWMYRMEREAAEARRAAEKATPKPPAPKS